MGGEDALSGDPAVELAVSGGRVVQSDAGVELEHDPEAEVEARQGVRLDQELCEVSGDGHGCGEREGPGALPGDQGAAGAIGGEPEHEVPVRGVVACVEHRAGGGDLRARAEQAAPADDHMPAGQKVAVHCACEGAHKRGLHRRDQLDRGLGQWGLVRVREADEVARVSLRHREWRQLDLELVRAHHRRIAVHHGIVLQADKRDDFQQHSDAVSVGRERQAHKRDDKEDVSRSLAFPRDTGKRQRPRVVQFQGRHAR